MVVITSSVAASAATAIETTSNFLTLVLPGADKAAQPDDVTLPQTA